MSIYGRLQRLVGGWGDGRERFDPPSVARELVHHLFRPDHGLPQVDWGEAEVWRERNGGVALRAVAGAWLDELRDSLEGEYRRWRHERIEGLAPAEDGVALRVASAGEKSLKVVEESLRPLRGEAPIGELAIIALGGDGEYYSFLAHHDRGEGEAATSGGSYINGGDSAMPLIVLHTQMKWSIENIIAHELTHHALHEMDLPLWLEEGFTQMMEERVTGYTGFKLDHEMAQRQGERWADGLGAFFSGDSFYSPAEDDQELSYHLAQWVVRAELSERPEAFFAFVRACGRTNMEAAARANLGRGIEEIVRGLLGLRESV